jgi:hypothetical protein
MSLPWSYIIIPFRNNEKLCNELKEGFMRLEERMRIAQREYEHVCWESLTIKINSK